MNAKPRAPSARPTESPAINTLVLSQPKHLPRLSDLLLLAVATVWGTRYGAAKGALAYYPVLGLLTLCIFICETFGVALTQASNAAFLISLCVVFTPFVEWWMPRRKPERAVFVFAGVSLLGAALLSGGLVGAIGWGDAPVAGLGCARRPAPFACQRRVLAGQCLPGAGLHGVCVFYAELGAEAQRA